jgi:hypothetical protein
MKRSDRKSSWASMLAGIAFAVTGLFGLVLARGAGEAQGAAASTNKYIGAEKCKNCHSAESAGNQYHVWQGVGHAKAFETLASDKAKEIAKAKGIEDPQKSEQCLGCHTTAFGVSADLIKKGFDPKHGVQCESCHGPGEAHFKARFAAAAKGGGEEGFGDEKDKAAAYQKIPDGEMVTKTDQKTCLSCHNEKSPTFKPFCFHERSAKIAHLDPRKPRTAEEHLVCGCEKCACEHGCEPGKCGVPSKEKK